MILERLKKNLNPEVLLKLIKNSSNEETSIIPINLVNTLPIKKNENIIELTKEMIILKK
tara:strand:- start:208 stop:384 length:177 start_codon:yes stop_codon:yes gene_type:complete